MISDPAIIGIQGSSRLIETARQPGFRLTALAKKNDVLPGKNGILDRGNDRMVVAVDAREERFALAHRCDQIRPHFFTDQREGIAGWL